MPDKTIEWERLLGEAEKTRSRCARTEGELDKEAMI